MASSRLDRWLVEQGLAGTERAGQGVRRRARRAQREFVRHRWRPLVGLVLTIWVLGTVGALSLPERFQMFGAGVVATAGVFVVLVVVVLYSGTAHLLLGDGAERDTARELRSLRRDGWKVVHQLPLSKHSDIDHVAIGPPGVVVVETKWRVDEHAFTERDPYVPAAVDQAKRNARSIRSVLSRHVPPDAVVPVIATWGPALRTHVERAVDGVSLVPGDDVARWIRSRADEDVLDPAQIDAGFDVLARQLVARDRWIAEHDRRPPRSLTSHFTAVVFAYAGFTGALVGLVALLERHVVGALAGVAGVAALGLWLRRRPVIGAIGWGMLAAGATLVLVVAGAALYVLLA